MISREIRLFIALLFCVTAPLLSEDTSHDGFSYCSRCFQLEENRYMSGQKELYEQLNYLRRAHNIVLDFLNTADEESFYEQLRLLKPSLEMMMEVSRQAFDQTYLSKHSDRRPIELDGAATYLFTNIFSQSRPLTDKERTEAYEEMEKRQHPSIVLPRLLLIQESLQALIPAQPYNFIVNLQKEAYVSYEQRYRLHGSDGKSHLNSPNHTLLAGNNPVLSAGVLYRYKVGRKEIYVISCSSGHFHPTPESLLHMKAYLVKLGVPEEAILTLSLTYDQIVSKLHMMKYQRTSS